MLKDKFRSKSISQIAQSSKSSYYESLIQTDELLKPSAAFYIIMVSQYSMTKLIAQDGLNSQFMTHENSFVNFGSKEICKTFRKKLIHFDTWFVVYYAVYTRDSLSQCPYHRQDSQLQ